MYIGCLNCLRTEPGSVFTSERRKKLTKLTGIQSRLSCVQAHSLLGIHEKYHGRLRYIYRKVRFAHPQLIVKLSSNTAVKEMNDTMSENGLVPT